ncbi:MAG: DNA polymerase III subunit delta [Candidatus Baltobacteraceae bacterium]
MKYYDFIEKRPAIGKLLIIEGTERVLAERALDAAIERLLPPEVRDMNLERFNASGLESGARLSEAAQAMPFLADRRVVVLTDAQTLKTAMRREVWAAAENVPEGNTLIVCDLLSPRSKRPEPFGAMAGRSALRVDTSAEEDVRARFIQETLEALNVTAEPRAVDALARSSADLASVRNDLQKLALSGKKITFKELETESLSVEDPKAYQYAGALIEGRPDHALAIAHELFASDRAAAVPLIYALATECGYLWELARPGGEIPARMRWRERALRPIAARVGEARARRAFERAIAAFDSIVTGKVDDPELVVDMLTAELSTLSAKR